MNLSLLLEKTLSLLKIRPQIGGLEISDSVIHFARLEQGRWNFKSLRLPPGLIVGGKIENYSQLVDSLKGFRAGIVGKPKSKQKIDVVVSLSSINIYSQVFSLPMIQGENLEKAIQLNIQMVSPMDTSQAYSGWQLVGEDKKSVRLEILSAFIDRAVVDQIAKALQEAGFVIHAMESRALSLARFLREMANGIDKEAVYVILNIDSGGLEFLIVRKSQLYFQFSKTWKEIQGEEQQISKEIFDSLITLHTQQVLNFYRSHWAEPLQGIFLLTNSFQDQVKEIIQGKFNVPVFDLNLKGEEPIHPSWFVSVGSAIRSRISPREDREISLLGITARENFIQHQLLLFFEFWRVLIPASLSILALGFLGTGAFLSYAKEESMNTKIVEVGAAQSKEVSLLEERVDNFNMAVEKVGYLLSHQKSLLPQLSLVFDVATSSEIVILRYFYQDELSPIVLSGKTTSEDRIKSFIDALKATGQFSKVDLPLTEIRTGPDGSSFSLILWPKTEATE